MNDRPKIVVLFHANCPDGFAAGWAAWTVLGDAATYIPVQYNHPVPVPAQTAERLFILDFSYPRDTIESLADAVDQLVVLDHHESAMLALADLPYAKFDMGKSGCVLAWEHFRPGDLVPLLLQYVQDRDLWTWKKPQSRMVSAWIGTLERDRVPEDFNGWRWYVESFEDDNEYRAEKCKIGSGILKAQSIIVERAVRAAWWTVIEGEFGSEYNVPCVNMVPELKSETGELLCQSWPEAPFAATFFATERDEMWSLRSRNGFDVSLVAKHNGGGGHRAAAGFTRRRP